MDSTKPSPAPVQADLHVSRDDPRYPGLVRGFNQRFVGRPRYVQLCRNTEEVRQGVQAALDAGRRITVRGGGHCYEDFVSDNDGVILDLSPLQGVYEQDGRFCIEGGSTLWNVYTQLAKVYSVTLPGGSCYSVGAGGHIVGGGYGLLSRQYGLTVDWLQSVELVYVTATRRAEVLTVSRDAADPAERDLFWAHQGGGGGNFGVITKYWFAGLPPAPRRVYLANVAWDWADLNPDRFAHLVTRYGAFWEQHSSPDSPYNGLFALLHLTHRSAGQITVTVQATGDDPAPIDAFLAAVEPAGLTRRVQQVPIGYHHLAGQPAETQHLPWLTATQVLNGSGPPRRGKYKSAYMNRGFPPAQIAALWAHLTRKDYDNPQALLQIDSYGGQINAVDAAATAIPQRSAIMKLQYQTYWTERREDKRNLHWIRDFYTAMYGPAGPLPDGTMDGCYVNYPDVDLIDWPYLYYKDNYPRLQRTKARWDPLDVFHHAQSIRLPSDPVPEQVA